MQDNNKKVGNIEFEKWVNKAKLLGIYERDFDIRVKTTYKIEDGTDKLYGVNYYELVKYKGKSKYLDIPPFDYICDKAFESNEYIEEIVINKQTDLGIGVFKWCRNLKKVTIQGDIKELPRGTFEGCINLKSVELPKSYKITLGVYCFTGCTELRHINTSNIESIKYGALMSTGIGKIILGENIQSIGSDIVLYCRNLTEIVVLTDDYKKENLFDSSMQSLNTVYCKEKHKVIIQKHLRKAGLKFVKVVVIE